MKFKQLSALTVVNLMFSKIVNGYVVDFPKVTVSYFFKKKFDQQFYYTIEEMQNKPSSQCSRQKGGVAKMTFYKSFFQSLLCTTCKAIT